MLTSGISRQRTAYYGLLQARALALAILCCLAPVTAQDEQPAPHEAQPVATGAARAGDATPEGSGPEDGAVPDEASSEVAETTEPTPGGDEGAAPELPPVAAPAAEEAPAGDQDQTGDSGETEAEPAEEAPAVDAGEVGPDGPSGAATAETTDAGPAEGPSVTSDQTREVPGSEASARPPDRRWNLQLAEVRRRKASQRLALQDARDAGKQLARRLRREPPRVGSGGIGEQATRDEIAALGEETDEWEAQIQATRDARKRWLDVKVRCDGELEASGAEAGPAATCSQSCGELVSVLDDLDTQLADNIELAGLLSEAVQQALEERRLRALSVRSVSRLSLSTLTDAGPQFGRWGSELINPMSEWLRWHSARYYAFLVLTLLIGLAMGVAGARIMQDRLQRAAERRSDHWLTRVDGPTARAAVPPLVHGVAWSLAIPFLHLPPTALRVGVLIIGTAVPVWAIARWLQPWTALPSQNPGGSGVEVSPHRRSVAMRVNSLLLVNLVGLPVTYGLSAYDNSETPVGVLVHLLYGLAFVSALVWLCYGREGWLSLLASEPQTTDSRLRVALQVLVPVLAWGLVGVTVLRVLGYYNLALYLGRNLPLTVIAPLAANWVRRLAVPWLARLEVWASAQADEEQSAKPRVSTLLNICFSLSLLFAVLSILLVLWGRSTLAARLQDGSLWLAIGIGVGGLISAIGLPLIARPFRVLRGGWAPQFAAALSVPTALLGIVIAINYAARELVRPQHHETLARVYHGALAALATYAVLRLIGRLASHYLDLAKEAEKPEVTPGVMLGRKFVNIVVIALGVAFILRQSGYDITPVLASLGVAGIAVAMALQDTLKNLFAGLYVMMDGSLKPGDFVQLDTGEAGFIEDIGWRNTKIRPYANNIIVMPNSAISEARVVNQHLPVQEQSVYIGCGVSYESDLDYVEDVCVEVARKTMARVEGSALDWDPVVRYKEFGDSNINFLIVLRVKEAAAQYLLTHEFMKDLFRRFQREGIEINYPVRNVYLREQTPTEPSGLPPVPEQPARVAPGIVDHETVAEGEAHED